MAIIPGMRKPSPSMVVSLTALFISLGGTSYAVTSLDDNSVTTTKIRDGAVSTPKLATAAVDATKIKLDSINGSHLRAGAVKLTNIYDGSVDSAKIKDGSIGTSDVKPNAFGDLTFRLDSNQAHSTPGIRVTIPGTELANDRWTLVDSFKLASGHHLALASADVLIGRETSGLSNAYCSMSRGVPAATGSTTYDTQRIHISTDSFVQARVLLMSPVTFSATTQIGLYCKLSHTDPDEFAMLITAPRWNAIHLTAAHAPPS